MVLCREIKVLLCVVSTSLPGADCREVSVTSDFISASLTPGVAELGTFLLGCPFTHSCQDCKTK